MSDIDNKKQTKDKDLVQKAFEGFQEEKYKDWKKLKEETLPTVVETGTDPVTQEKTYELRPSGKDDRTNEQKAFENYAVQNGFTTIIVNSKEGNNYNEKILKDWTKRIEDGPISHQIFINDKYLNGEISDGDKVILFLKKGCISDYPDKTLTIYGTVRSLSKPSKSMMVIDCGFSTGDMKVKETYILQYEDNANITLETIKNKIKNKDTLTLNFNEDKLGNLPKQGGHLMNDNVIVTIPASKISDSELDVTLYGTFNGYVSVSTPKQIKIMIKGYSTNSDGKASGGQTPKPVPTERPDVVLDFNEDIELILGEYGVNVFDYRTMSRDNYFAVDGKVFYNRDNTAFNHMTNSEAKLYNRLRKDQFAHIISTLLETNNGDVPTKFQIKATHGQGDTEINITHNNNIDAVVKNNQKVPGYSYFRFQLGGDGKPTKSKVKIEAYYGSINPEVLDQRFVFKSYNGYVLRSMPLFNERDGSMIPAGGGAVADPKIDASHMRDFYQRKKRGDILERKIGLFKLKNITEYIYDDTSNNNILFIPVPSDCKEVTSKLMSNNLCDITQQESEAPIPFQNKPFFVRGLTTKSFKVPKKDNKGKIIYDKTGKPKMEDKDKQCFQILLTKGFVQEWTEHLSKTEIMYELNKPVTEYIRSGGQVYVLENGDVVYTHDYKDVSVPKDPKKKKYYIQLEGNLLGGPNKLILFEDIVQVIDLAGAKKDTPKLPEN